MRSELGYFACSLNLGFNDDATTLNDFKNANKCTCRNNSVKLIESYKSYEIYQV